MLFVDDILVWETAIVSTNSAVYGTASLCGSTVADMIIPVTITVGSCLVRICRRSARLLQSFDSRQRHARWLPPLLLPCADASHRDFGQTSVHQYARPGTLRAATVHACHTPTSTAVQSTQQALTSPPNARIVAPSSNPRRPPMSLGASSLCPFTAAHPRNWSCTPARLLPWARGSSRGPRPGYVQVCTNGSRLCLNMSLQQRL